MQSVNVMGSFNHHVLMSLFSDAFADVKTAVDDMAWLERVGQLVEALGSGVPLTLPLAASGASTRTAPRLSTNTGS
jgi:hypothetical protein